jgi:hypothetical protein
MMLMNDRAEQAAIQAATLNDYMARWHAWSHPKPMNGTDHVADPAFRDAESYRGWESEDELHDKHWFKFVMTTIDFIVTGDRKGQGAMESPYKDAILIQARNLHTGFNVWVSQRLPRDSGERLRIVEEARRILTARMRAAGVDI